MLRPRRVVTGAGADAAPDDSSWSVAATTRFWRLLLLLDPFEALRLPFWAY